VKKTPSWAEHIKTIVRRRYDHVAAADAFPPDGARRAHDAGYPAEWLETLPASIAASYSGCGFALDGIDFSGVGVAVDLGCGAGLDTLLLQTRLGAGAILVAIDLSPRMAARAAEAASGCFAAAADMERLPLADHCADFVYANASFNLAADKQAAFAEAFRILRRGGRLVARDLVRVGPLPQEVAETSISSLAGVLKESKLRAALAAAGFTEIAVDGHRPFSYVLSVRLTARVPN
jgi:SAM-dependent methyltransferase